MGNKFDLPAIVWTIFVVLALYGISIGLSMFITNQASSQMLPDPGPAGKFHEKPSGIQIYEFINGNNEHCTVINKFNSSGGVAIHCSFRKVDSK